MPKNSVLKAGDKAPSFTLKDPDGNVIALWEDKLPEAQEHHPVDQADGTA